MKALRLWSVVRGLGVPVLMTGLAVVLLREPLVAWLQGEDHFDRDALTEWVREARVYQTLPDLADNLVKFHDVLRILEEKNQSADPKDRPSRDSLEEARRFARSNREQIEVHLAALCDPVTKVYPGRLPLFVTVYRMTVHFDEAPKEAITWDSGKPVQPHQFRELKPVQIHARGVWVDVDYQLSVHARLQFNERQKMVRWRWVSGGGLVLIAIAGIWYIFQLSKSKERDRRRLQAEQQARQAERLRLEEELKRQEAERKQGVAEHAALELRSQVFANIGLMAGSYAHNIKNLLVRPNDLLGRCLEQDGLSPEQGHMLHEVRDTLGTVTERLQQILQTVRRDPSQATRGRLDLNALARNMHAAWNAMAQDKWKMAFQLDLGDGEPLWIEGDRSQLDQALENLLFNARDATFEMRNILRDQARKDGDQDGSPRRRQALIAAAGWKGQVVLRTRREGERAVLEIEDNGIGMSDEVRQRCTETHFSTKRDNALFAGLSSGMGLGLSFVQAILEHHGAMLEIVSTPLHGARFRVSFPLAARTD